ncbi:MAG: hypothetical protein LC785_02105 [Acidobacteria bacterium]|nr:hypothetical protein [Acidobacteriota bacterium]
MIGVINGSKQLKHIFSNSVEDFPNAANLSELQKYMADLKRMSALYRKRLPRNVLTSRAYKKNVKVLEKERGHQFEINRGDNFFGVGENVEVYGVCRDLFCFRLVEEKGKLRVLGFILGD